MCQWRATPLECASEQLCYKRIGCTLACPEREHLAICIQTKTTNPPKLPAPAPDH